MKNLLLLVVVFFSGMTTLGIELAASRLLAPFFGSSLPVWANLIGLILVYLTVGYYLGGKWADRDPREVTLYRVVSVAGFAIGLIPFVARPILNLAVPALEQFDAGLGIASFAGVLVLFSIPITLLGCVSPFAIRISSRSVESIGATAGQLYALSTLGSILGVFLTVFWTIPALGTRRTFLGFALLLSILALVGILRAWGVVRAIKYVALVVVIIALAVFDSSGVVKASSGLVYETESAYNYIQVIDDNGTRLLLLNEGQAYQSAYRPGATLIGGIWDLFLLAPYFQPNTTPRDVHSVLLVGLAAGTISKEYSLVYGPIPMDGVEIDPTIIEVGQKYFAMNEPNLTPIADDGRHFLQTTPKTYDVIALDAYRQPYIPFHLATVEFFRETRAHLTPRGVVALNAARTARDYRLVDALAATMRAVFPSVYLLDHPNDANTLIVATPNPTTLADFHANLARLTEPNLKQLAEKMQSRAQSATRAGPIYTDDKAPVEELIHSIILDFALGR